MSLQSRFPVLNVPSWYLRLDGRSFGSFDDLRPAWYAIDGYFKALDPMQEVEIRLVASDSSFEMVDSWPRVIWEANCETPHVLGLWLMTFCEGLYGEAS